MKRRQAGQERSRAIDHLVKEAFEELRFIQERFFSLCTGDLVRLADRVAGTFRQGGRLVTFGTGTSGHLAQILANALTHKIAVNRPPLPALALSCDASLLGDLAERTSAEELFTRQMEALGRRGDMALAFSWDGDSPATLGALVRARESGLETAALLGRDGGKIKNYTDLALVVEAEKPARVHEVHLVAAQVLAQLVERHLFPL